METSYGERSAWVSLIALAASSGWYLYTYLGDLAAGSLGFDDMLGGVIGLVILIAVVEIAYHIVLGIEHARPGEASSMLTDERDSAIATKSERYAGFVLSAGVVAGIFSSAFLSGVMTANILLLALALAESVKLVAQLVYYRAGV